MTAKYQAGVGPNMTFCHIYEIPPEGERAKISLCGSVNVARNYKGPISIANAKLCQRCFKLLQRKIPSGSAITADLIGVSSIEE